MRTLSRDRRAERPGRWGFTLVELLVAITIIAILLALLIPAINSARFAARVTQVQSEISRLNSACADFKAKFGMNPPSTVTIYESSAAWAVDPRSMGIIRQIWPQYTFADNDINADTDTTDQFELTKGECLVFFLGGIPDTAANGFAPKGFSQNPANPFAIGGSNRVGPFFEFDISRFVDTDGDGLQEFRDSMPGQLAPYLYLSAYDGQGYVASEAPPQLEAPYRQSPSTFWNAQSFQIISPGADGLYGGMVDVPGPPVPVAGGAIFNAETAGVDLVRSDINVDLDTLDDDIGEEWREPERDNITNFHQGQLAPN